MKEVLIFASGLVLFLFGMRKLSAEVQQLFTSRIREYIKYSVRRPVYGLLTGIATTILFQSSGATTLLTVGMVSAGLMTFYHSLGLILGADIGTVLTVQLVVWKFADISPLIIVSGGILWLTGREKWKDAGEAIFYFGLLFFGLSLVAMTTAPLKDNQAVIRFFQETKNPLLGLGVGIIFTGIVQASVIPISILAILAQQDLITIENALPVVFGANVGTTVTALMASAVANISGKRSAVSHLFFKCFGAVACMVAFPWLILTLKTLSSSVAQQIVLGHLLFNLFIVASFIFFLKPFAGLIEKVIPGAEDVVPLWPEFLDDRYLASPEEALMCVRKELQREIILVHKIFVESLLLVKDYKEWKRQNIIYVEFVVDVLRREIVNFLRKISCQQLSPALSQKLFTYTAMANDIERIGDHAVILAKLASNKYQAGVSFTEMGKKELAEIERQATENLRDAVSLIGERNREKIENISLREEDIDVRVKEARERHLVRYYEGICQAEAGPIFIEMLIHLERISDLCQNVAEYVDELKDFGPCMPLGAGENFS
jgi:phosphate:Na+ symporter